MSVVFVNRFAWPDHSATSQILSDLAAELAGRGLPVAIVASRQRYDEPGARLPAQEAWRGVKVHRIWTSRFGRASLPGRALDYLSFYLSLPATLWGLLKPGDVVVAKTDPPLVSLLVGLLAWMRGARLVNWLQDVFPEVAVNLGQPKIPRPLAWLLKKLRNFSLRRSVLNVVIGERMAEYLSLQAPSARFMVIPNWAHETTIQPMPTATSKLRQQLGLADSFIVAYSGNLGRAHDTQTLLDVALALRERQDIVFLVTGGGHGYEQLQRQIAGLGLSNLRMLPYQDLESLSDSMAAADLHLLSLRPELEGQIVPSKFYGIAAAARPMAFIGDPDGEVARLVAEARCGFSVKPGDSAALVAAILELQGNPQRCLELGQNARIFLGNRFSRESAHEAWYRTLVEVGAATTQR